MQYKYRTKSCSEDQKSQFFSDVIHFKELVMCRTLWGIDWYIICLVGKNHPSSWGRSNERRRKNTVFYQYLRTFFSVFSMSFVRTVLNSLGDFFRLGKCYINRFLIMSCKRLALKNKSRLGNILTFDSRNKICLIFVLHCIAVYREKLSGASLLSRVFIWQLRLKFCITKTMSPID